MQLRQAGLRPGCGSFSVTPHTEDPSDSGKNSVQKHEAYPGEIKMRIIMARNTVISNLKRNGADFLGYKSLVMELKVRNSA